MQDAGNLQSNPTDAFAKRDLNEHNRAVSEKVAFTVHILKLISSMSTYNGLKWEYLR